VHLWLLILSAVRSLIPAVVPLVLVIVALVPALCDFVLIVVGDAHLRVATPGSQLVNHQKLLRVLWQHLRYLSQSQR
jgi:hypothetical protein